MKRVPKKHLVQYFSSKEGNSVHFELDFNNLKDLEFIKLNILLALPPPSLPSFGYVTGRKNSSYSYDWMQKLINAIVVSFRQRTKALKVQQSVLKCLTATNVSSPRNKYVKVATLISVCSTAAPTKGPPKPESTWANRDLFWIEKDLTLFLVCIG